MRYTKKPVTIEAIRFVGLTDMGDPLFDTKPMAGAVPDWLMEAMAAPEENDGAIWTQRAGADGHPSHLCIATLEGVLIVSPGDWIIRGIMGELYPCKPDIFEATYDAASGPAEALSAALAETDVEHPSDLPTGAVGRLRGAAKAFVIGEGFQPQG